MHVYFFFKVFRFCKLAFFPVDRWPGWFQTSKGLVVSMIAADDFEFRPGTPAFPLNPCFANEHLLSKNLGFPLLNVVSKTCISRKVVKGRRDVGDLREMERPQGSFSETLKTVSISDCLQMRHSDARAMAADLTWNEVGLSTIQVWKQQPSKNQWACPRDSLDKSWQAHWKQWTSEKIVRIWIKKSSRPGGFFGCPFASSFHMIQSFWLNSRKIQTKRLRKLWP